MNYIRSSVVSPCMVVPKLLKRFLSPPTFAPLDSGGRSGRSRTVERSVEPVPGTPVSVSSVDGKVVVEPTEADEVELHGVVRPNGKRGSVDAAELVVSRDEDGVGIDVEHDDRGFLSQSEGATVELTVRLPEGVPLASADTVNGELTVRGVSGDARLESVNGSVTVTDVDGRVELATVNGRVEATGIRELGHAESTNGSVDVSVVELTDDLTAETTTGSVTIHLPADAAPRLDVGSALGSTTVEGIAPGRDASGPTVSASATTGSVTVRGQ
jgi:hypothetical protein